MAEVNEISVRYRIVRSAVQTEQGSGFLQLQALGERWVCSGICLLHTLVRQNETVCDDGRSARRIHWLYNC